MPNPVVLVTGGAGFIGSALIRDLLQNGAKVLSYDNYLHGTPENFSGLEDFVESEQLIVIRADVHDQSLLKKQIRDYQVEYLINCIGDPFIPTSYHYPERCYNINAEGTRSVLEGACGCDIRRIIHISTCEVYGINDAYALTEKDRFNPCGVYAESKCRAERYCHEFFTSFQRKNLVAPLVVARLFNCYGPRATHPYIIPEIIRQLHAGSTLHLGNLTERDFTYVHDTAKAVIALLTAKLPAADEELEVINIGSGLSYSISSLARSLAELMEISDFRLVTEQSQQRPDDIPRFVCAHEKLSTYTDWTPEVGIKEGLRKTIAWFREHGGRWDFSRNDQPEPVTGLKAETGELLQMGRA